MSAFDRTRHQLNETSIVVLNFFEELKQRALAR
jgi:hypothetical protein